jgi:hypothetical protein
VSQFRPADRWQGILILNEIDAGQR